MADYNPDEFFSAERRRPGGVITRAEAYDAVIAALDDETYQFERDANYEFKDGYFRACEIVLLKLNEAGLDDQLRPRMTRAEIEEAGFET